MPQQLLVKRYKNIAGLDYPVGTPEYVGFLEVARQYHIPGWFKDRFDIKVKSGRDLDLLPPNECMERAIGLLIPESEYKMSPWGERLIAGFTGTVDKRYSELVVQAPAAASKSQTFGLLFVLHFITSPLDTTMRLISTDLKGLRQRSWSAVAQYFDILKKQGCPGVYSRQSLAIFNPDEEDDKIAAASQKAGIFAFALQSGTLEQGISRCIGTHFPSGSVCLLADEAQAINPFFYAGLSNLWIGTRDVRLISLGNPMTLTDALAQRAEPKDGWASVSVEDDGWISKRNAQVVHLNGERSPALEHPDEYPFLINAEGIQKVLDENFGRKDSLGYKSMVEGWWSDGDDISTLLPRSMLVKHHALEDVQWLNGLPDHVVAGLDPAGGGGDALVLTVGYVGTFLDGTRGIWFAPPYELDVDPNGSLPVQYQVSERIKEIRKQHDFDLADLAVDESGLQLFSDTIEMESHAMGIMRVSFGARPDTTPVSTLDNTPKNVKYANMVTQLWMDVATMVQFGQVRGINDKAAHEFSIRQVLPRRPLRVESKIELKKRLKRSPDNADSLSLTTYAAIKRGYLMPGALVSSPAGFNPARWNPQNKRLAPNVDVQEPDYSGNPLDM